jgi:hypothetical protein
MVNFQIILGNSESLNCIRGETQAAITGVSSACHESFTSYDEAHRTYERMYHKGSVTVVDSSGRYHRSAVTVPPPSGPDACVPDFNDIPAQSYSAVRPRAASHTPGAITMRPRYQATTPQPEAEPIAGILRPSARPPTPGPPRLESPPPVAGPSHPRSATPLPRPTHSHTPSHRHRKKGRSRSRPHIIVKVIHISSSDDEYDAGDDRFYDSTDYDNSEDEAIIRQAMELNLC